VFGCELESASGEVLGPRGSHRIHPLSGSFTLWNDIAGTLKLATHNGGREELKLKADVEQSLVTSVIGALGAVNVSEDEDVSAVLEAMNVRSFVGMCCYLEDNVGRLLMSQESLSDFVVYVLFLHVQAGTFTLSCAVHWLLGRNYGNTFLFPFHPSNLAAKLLAAGVFDMTYYGYVLPGLFAGRFRFLGTESKRRPIAFPLNLIDPLAPPEPVAAAAPDPELEYPDREKKRAPESDEEDAPPIKKPRLRPGVAAKRRKEKAATKQ